MRASAKLSRAVVATIAAAAGLILLAPIIALTLAMWCVALLARCLRRVLEPTAARWQDVIEYYPKIGWKPKANLNTHCSFAAGVFRLRTGEDGWAGRTTLEESDVVVFGDSYAFGFGVDTKRAFFELNRRPQIKAIGSPGYNMVQELLWMKTLAPRLAGKLVVWFVYFGNDLYDNLLPNLYNYRMPFVRRGKHGDWETVTDHVHAGDWPFNHEKNSRLEEKFHGVFGDNALSKRVYEGCAYLIREGRDTCREANCDLVVMSVPWPVQLDRRAWERRCSEYGPPESFDVNAPDRRIGEICGGLGVPLIEGRQWLETRHHIPDEGHWNEDGHRRIAGLLGELYQRRNGARRSEESAAGREASRLAWAGRLTQPVGSSASERWK